MSFLKETQRVFQQVKEAELQAAEEKNIAEELLRRRQEEYLDFIEREGPPLLSKWDHFGLGDILKEVRDAVWPGAHILNRALILGLDEQRVLVRGSGIEEWNWVSFRGGGFKPGSVLIPGERESSWWDVLLTGKRYKWRDYSKDRHEDVKPAPLREKLSDDTIFYRIERNDNLDPSVLGRIYEVGSSTYSVYDGIEGTRYFCEDILKIRISRQGAIIGEVGGEGFSLSTDHSNVISTLKVELDSRIATYLKRKR